MSSLFFICVLSSASFFMPDLLNVPNSVLIFFLCVSSLYPNPKL